MDRRLTVENFAFAHRLLEWKMLTGSPARSPASAVDGRSKAEDFRGLYAGVPGVSLPSMITSERLPTSELSEVQQERDQAWKRAQSLERTLEIERHTSRAVATEAVEAQETWESRVAELMNELAASESRLQQYHLLEQEHRNFASKHRLMQDLYEKMLPTVCQTQGVPPCDHAKENVALLERLLEVTEELQSASEAKKTSAKEQVPKDKSNRNRERQTF